MYIRVVAGVAYVYNRVVADVPYGYNRVVVGVAYVYNRVVADVPYVYNRVVAGVAYVYNRVVADVPHVCNRVVVGIIPQNSMASSSGLRLISHGLTITYSTRVLRYATHPGPSPTAHILSIWGQVPLAQTSHVNPYYTATASLLPRVIKRLFEPGRGAVWTLFQPTLPTGRPTHIAVIRRWVKFNSQADHNKSGR